MVCQSHALAKSGVLTHKSLVNLRARSNSRLISTRLTSAFSSQLPCPQESLVMAINLSFPPLSANEEEK